MFDRLGVAGAVGRTLSSLLGGRLRSPVDGCEVIVGLEASDKDRDFGERVITAEGSREASG